MSSDTAVTTMLSRAGVAPRMAQELLRHSDIRLTMNTYTKLKLEGLSNAVNALPDIGGDDPEGHELQQTGTCAEVWGAENGAV